MPSPENITISEGQLTVCLPGQRLPFEPSKTLRIGGGGYGAVFEELILRRGLKYKKSSSQTSDTYCETPLRVARKEFSYAPDFDREYKFLQILNSSPNRHDRIMKALAALSFKDYHHILFPLATMDLNNMFKTANFSTFPLEDLLTETSHLSDALSWLHGGICITNGTTLTGCHMDLKPENILIFPDVRSSASASKSSAGIWKITDFSTSILTDEHGQSPLTPPKLFVDTYTAPEIDASSEKIASDLTPSDIWSLGCILFEIIHAHVDGRKIFLSWKDNIGNLPNYFEESTHGKIIQPRVHQWLLDEGAENEILSSCKGIILDMLKIESSQRPSAQAICKRLNTVIGKLLLDISVQ